jgi:hypothetical protein
VVAAQAELPQRGPQKLTLSRRRGVGLAGDRRYLETAGEEVPGRVASRVDEQEEEVLELLGRQALALDLRVDEHAREVIAAPLSLRRGDVARGFQLFLEDEKRFIDFKRSSVWAAKEIVFIDEGTS